MENATKHKIVLVEWLDAESIDEWTDSHDVDHGVAKILSSGFLIGENNEALTLALNHDTKNEAYSCIMKIPRGMIVSTKLINT